MRGNILNYLLVHRSVYTSSTTTAPAASCDMY